MHRPTLFDWISRVIMLVLAGMVSLSIIGSIAAIPYGIDGPTGLSGSRSGTQASSQVEPQRPVEAAPGQSQQQPTTAQAAAPQGQIAAPAPDQDDDQRWLEAITYALLALVGLTAFATLLLWRSLIERRRIADALEAISLAPRA